MMGQIRRAVERVWASYRIRGFWGFIEATSIYLLKQCQILPLLRRVRFCVLPYKKGIKIDRRKTANGQVRVLDVDTISEPQARSNVNGVIKAYRKVSTLITFDYRKLARQYGQSRMNVILVQTAINFKPDLIHLGKSELIYGSTVKKIKQCINTCVIHFYGDFRWEIQPWVVDIGKYADCTLFYHKQGSLIKQYRELGIRNPGFWWIGTDPDIFYPRGGDKVYNVVFMANNSDFLEGHKLRRELIAAIAKREIQIHVFGNGWEYLSNVPNVYIHPFVDEEELAKVCSASKITLGINAVNNVRMYASWRRTFNSMASGAFHLTHYVPGLEDVFKNRKHLVWFNSIAEAVELMEYYLAHREEREKIAKAGRQEVLAHHTWDLRIAEMIERAAKYQVKSGFRSLYQSSYDKLLRSGQYKENPELDDDMVESMFIRWRRGRFLLEPAQRKWYENIAKSIKGLHVCDVGCGSGLGSLILAQEAESVVGIEKIGISTEFAQKCFPVKNIEFMNEDIVRCSYPDGSFDAIVAIEVIEHIFDYHEALKAMKRLLKNNGKLYISSPNRNNDNLGKNRPKNKYHVREWTIREFHEILSLYFEDVEFFDFTLKYRQEMDSKVTPVIAICGNDKSARRTTLRVVKYNLNFDDLLPCCADFTFTFLKKLVQFFPEIKITIFIPINSRDWGDNQNYILDYPERCRKVAQLPSKNFEIALHGYNHHLNDAVKTPEFKYLSKEEAMELLLKCEDAFKRAGIPFTRGFRPPRREMSKGTEQALEALGYLYLSDSPRFCEEHKDIKIPRIFPNSDIKENEEYCDVRPYKHLLLDTREYYIHRGHLV